MHHPSQTVHQHIEVMQRLPKHISSNPSKGKMTWGRKGHGEWMPSSRHHCRQKRAFCVSTYCKEQEECIDTGGQSGNCLCL